MQDNVLHSNPHIKIEDGYHRVLAGICLDWSDEFIRIKNYNYIRPDVLDYLLGKSDVKPVVKKSEWLK
jgi:hypothetical protein